MTSSIGPRIAGPQASCWRAVLLAVGVAVAVCGCSPEEPDPRPNIVWIVWDTVRADHLSLYGYEKQTTPNLDKWAAKARVYDNCVSITSTTVPSHASMFTGLMPTEHGTDNVNSHLDNGLTTVAELLQQEGYRTYLFAANPFISAALNFDQGFDVAEQPWTPKFREQALAIVKNKIDPRDRSSELPAKLKSGIATGWMLKACGQLAQRGVEEWLDSSDDGQPFFIFLNYMEAHRPYIPPEEYRRRMMTPQEVAKSYQIDRSWVPMWAYTFGLHDYTTEELNITAATYDATLAELDELLRDLLAWLESNGHLGNTVVILTADHGEHLGEHHLLDHQYSLYQPLLRVPLVIQYPKQFAPGRDSRPVMNLDLFTTVLDLTGIVLPGSSGGRSVSLLAPPEERIRIAEYPTAPPTPYAAIREAYPGWDSSPWDRSLQAIFDGRYKYIRASDDRDELYDLTKDPRELMNLIRREPQVAQELAGLLDSAVANFEIHQPTEHPDDYMPEDLRKRLEDLGYTGGEKDDNKPH